MNTWNRCREVFLALLVVGLTFQASPLAWAQLREVDPALDAAVEALILHDPALVNDPELAQLCRQVAEATVENPRERAAVIGEAAALMREGTDLSTLIPTEVREAARERFTAVQGQMREQLETLRTSDPEKAREVELMMREGERQMESFTRGEHYVPSPEMMEHAKEMFGDWKESMMGQGAPPEMLARAEMEFTQWSGGEMMGTMGPGHEFGGPAGGMPSPEQMEAMVAAGQMTPEQLQMATEYAANPEGFMSSHSGYEAFGPEAFGSGGPPGTTWEGGPHEGMIFEAYGPGSMETSEHWAGSPEMEFATPEQMEQFREVMEQYQPENQNDILQQQQFDLVQPPSGETLVRTEPHVADHNNDGDTTDPVDTHPHEIFRHSDGSCHDHGTGGATSC